MEIERTALSHCELCETIPRFWWPKRDQISELVCRSETAWLLQSLCLDVRCKPIIAKGQEYKDQIHDIFVKQGITDGLKTACARLVLMLIHAPTALG